MNHQDWSRRRFALTLGAGLWVRARIPAQDLKPTAREVIERIRQNVGVPWRTETVDTFKAGNPDTLVKGVATTVMATLDVLQRAAQANTNLVITHEPTFYNHQDETKDFQGDPVYEFKRRFIEENDLVVWRFHDHWHARQPDGIYLGIAESLGWAGKQVGDDKRVYSISETTLGELAKQIQERLSVRALRVIGDPSTKVAKAALSPGFSRLMSAVTLLREVDVFIAGEPREWEGVEYVQDAIAAGERKGMIILGHAIGEEPGMRECANWLRTFVKDVPVKFVPAGEPFWRP